MIAVIGRSASRTIVALAVCIGQSIAGSSLIAAERSLALEVPDQPDLILNTSELEAQFGLELMTIDDPHYGERRSYRGIDLRQLLTQGGFEIGESLILECSDGYEIPFESSLLEDTRLRALIAVADIDPDPGLDWKLLQHGRHPVNPEPFYMIWSAAAEAQGLSVDASIIEKLPWPYQLTRIRRAANDTPTPPPRTATASVHSGYTIFIDECVKCHQLQERGGQLGPALDRPDGMTALLDDARLGQLITKVDTFFPGSKMPIYNEKLNTRQVADLIAFLRQSIASTQTVAE